MEAISYVNIFETKGIEYLVVISFMISFLFFVRMLLFSDTPEAQVQLETSGDVINATFLCRADHECPYKKPMEEEEEIAMASGG